MEELPSESFFSKLRPERPRPVIEPLTQRSSAYFFHVAAGHDDFNATIKLWDQQFGDSARSRYAAELINESMHNLSLILLRQRANDEVVGAVCLDLRKYPGSIYVPFMFVARDVNQKEVSNQIFDLLIRALNIMPVKRVMACFDTKNLTSELIQETTDSFKLTNIPIDIQMAATAKDLFGDGREVALTSLFVEPAERPNLVNRIFDQSQLLGDIANRIEQFGSFSGVKEGQEDELKIFSKDSNKEKDGSKDGGKEGKEITKDGGKDGGKDGEKDGGKDGEKDGGKDGGKDGEKDYGKDFGKDDIEKADTKDGGKDGKDFGKDSPDVALKGDQKDVAIDVPKDSQKDGKETVEKDEQKDVAIDVPKDGQKDGKETVEKDEQKDVAIDVPKDGQKDGKETIEKDEQKDVAMDKANSESRVDIFDLTGLPFLYHQLGIVRFNRYLEGDHFTPLV